MSNDRKIVEYSILYSGYVTNIIEDVNKAINKGWEPLGGICESYDTSREDGWLYQAMVKYE